MEVLEPSENLRIYNNGTTGTSGPSTVVPTRSASWDYTSRDWFQYPILTEAPSPVHVLAENVIFLAVLPMVAPQNAANPPDPGARRHFHRHRAGLPLRHRAHARPTRRRTRRTSFRRWFTS